MNFFSNDVGNDGSAVAAAINKATSSMLLSADWGQNLEICDMINTSASNVTSAVKMLRKQLRSDNATVVKLALELTDACVKNCTRAMHEAVGSRGFQTDMVSLAEHNKRSDALGFEVQEMARKLIQQWGIEFAGQRDTLPGFHDTYAMLRTKGLPFPEHESSAPVFTPPPVLPEDTAPPEITTTSDSVSGATPASGEDKLRQDIQVVQEKIDLCRDMLPESPGIEQDEALAEVVGFLEACQPRLSELIEAGMQGVLSEELLSAILHVNDELHKTLDAERQGTPIQPSKDSTSSNLLDMGDPVVPGATSASVAPDPVISMPTTNIEEDDDEEFTLSSSSRRKGKKPVETAAEKPTSADAYLGMLQAELGSPPSTEQQQNAPPEYQASISPNAPPPGQPAVNATVEHDPFSESPFDPPPATTNDVSIFDPPPPPYPAQTATTATTPATPSTVNTISVSVEPADPFGAVPELQPTFTQSPPPEPTPSSNPFDDPVFHGTVITPSDPNDFVTYQALSAEQILANTTPDSSAAPNNLASSLRQPSKEDVSAPQQDPNKITMTSADTDALLLN